VRYAQGGALYTTTYALRTAGDPTQLIAPMRRVLADVGVSIEGDVTVTTGIEYWNRTMKREQMLASLLGVFAFIAVVLCALGIYGLLAYSTTWRTREIGVLRVALGAREPQVVWLILWDALVPMAAGCGRTCGLVAE
jgi:ABC-type lipoprotein release transport system permease subunit